MSVDDLLSGKFMDDDEDEVSLNLLCTSVITLLMVPIRMTKVLGPETMTTTTSLL